MLSRAKFNSEVRNLHRQWRKEFRAEFFRERPYTRVYNNPTFVSDQIEFINEYLKLKQLDGATQENLKRIKRFLSLQNAVEEGKDMRLHFIGGNYVEVFVTVKDLKDIDIADVYTITDCETILIYKGKNRRWTPKSSDAVIDAMKYDLAFDGMDATLHYTFEENRSYMSVDGAIS